MEEIWNGGVSRMKEIQDGQDLGWRVIQDGRDHGYRGSRMEGIWVGGWLGTERVQRESWMAVDPE